MDCKVTCFERALYYMRPLPKNKINDGIEIINNGSLQDFLDFLVENSCCAKEAVLTLFHDIAMWESVESNYWEADQDKLNSLYDKVGLTEDALKEYNSLYKEMYTCLGNNGSLLVEDMSYESDGLKIFANGKKYKVTLAEEENLRNDEACKNTDEELEEIPVAETVYDVTFVEGDSKDSFKFTSPNKVADFIYDKTNHWMLASGVRTECYNLKLGEPVDFEHDDIKFIIKRIV